MNRRITAGLRLLTAAALLGTAAFSAEPFKDFTFKTVRPPAKGAKKLITIQIEPPSKKAPKAAPLTSTARGGPVLETMNAWFWDKISPARASAGPGRFTEALRVIDVARADQKPKVPALAQLRRIANAHGTDILLATIGEKVSPALVLAMIAVASSGDYGAHAGFALADLSTATPRSPAEFKRVDAPDPAAEIKAAVARMGRLLRRFDHDPILALAAYQAGAKAVDASAGVPPVALSRAYVPTVIATFQVARTLCITPPELYSDGCVFLPKELQ